MRTHGYRSWLPHPLSCCSRAGMGTQAWTPRRLVSENPDTFCCILIRRRLFAGGLSRTSTVDHNGLDHADCTTLRPSPRISTLHFRPGTISRTWSGWRPTQRRRIWKILTWRMSRRAKSADQGRARLKNRAMLAEPVRPCALHRWHIDPHC